MAGPGADGDGGAGAARPERDRAAERNRTRAATVRSRSPKRWAYGELTLPDIVDAASQLARRVGIAKVTMRAVCQELGLSSMSVYYYVPNKESLLDLVIDDACSRVEIPPADGGTWDERLRALMHNARRTFLQYPGLANRMQVRPVTSQAMRLGEAADRLLLEGGFADEEGRRYALAALINYLFGALAWESTLPSRSRNQDPWRPEHRTAGLTVTDRQAEWTYRQTMLSLDELFEYGLDMAIVGLRHKASGAMVGRRRR